MKRLLWAAAGAVALVGEAATARECVRADACARTNPAACGEFVPVAAVSLGATAEGHGISCLSDGNPATWTRFVDTTPDGRPATCSFTLDLGAALCTRGMRLVSQPDRWVSTSPFALKVSACADAAGRQILKPLAHAKDLHPAFCGESQFVTWPATTNRYYRVDVEDGGIAGVWRWGMYVDWGDLHARAAWGLPHNSAKETPQIDVAEVSFFDVLPDDFPGWNAHPARAFPMRRLHKDWLLQDFGFDGFAAVGSTNGAAYYANCWARRAKRLARVAAECPRIVFTKHYTISGDAELTGNAMVSDETRPGKTMNWRPGGQLCLLTVRADGAVNQEVLVDCPQGCIRDPDVSFDGRRILFTMRNSFKDDDYHLYTLDVETRELKQLTFSEPCRCADFEGVWTSGGKIIFQSTRCQQIIPCHVNENSNLYTCDADGKNIVRLGFDGGSTLYPQELPDGRILYTRYDYNDRNARFQQPLFTMNPDGTMQMEYYGNNSWYPTSLIHFRPIAGTQRLLGVASGHHVAQKGKLVWLDRAKGTQGDVGLTFVAGSDIEERPGVVPSRYEGHPVYMKARAAQDPVIDDFAMVHGAQWQYPYPLSERDWLVTFCPEGSLCGTKCGDHPNFGIYWQNAAGERELLAYDPEIECSQPVPLRPRRRVEAVRNVSWDPRASYGIFYVQNVYEGPGLKGVAHGTVKTLRVVALENRPAFIRRGSMYAPHDACFNEFIPYEGDISGEAVAVRGGAWDIKHVLGEVDVAPDGSCAFEVPSCNPVYFQLLDAEGRCVQTMRSWATLMPGEFQGCVGCHEAKTEVPPSTIAVARAKVQRLRPAPGQGAHPLLARLDRDGRLADVSNYLGVNAARSVAPDAPTEGFSYPRLVQPVLDRNCVRCHDGTEAKRPNLTGRLTDSCLAFRDWKPIDPGRRYSESYLALTAKGRQTSRLNWYSSTGRSEMLPPRSMGSSASAIMAYFKGAHHDVKASDVDRRVFACWIDLGVPYGGSYTESTTWTAAERERYEYYQAKRVAFAEQERRAVVENLNAKK